MAAAYLDSAKELLDLNVFCKPGENNVRITLKQTGSILFLVGVRSSLFLKLFCRFFEAFGEKNKKTRSPFLSIFSSFGVNDELLVFRTGDLDMNILRVKLCQIFVAGRGSAADAATAAAARPGRNVE